MRWVLIMLLAVACTRSRSSSSDAGALNASGASLDAAPGMQDASSTPRLLVGASTAPKCKLTYSCGLNHPGLGNSGDEVSVDLATCTKTVARWSKPYGENELPSREPPPAPPKTKLARDSCQKLEKLLTEVTDADAREARESAPIDTTACTFSAGCPEDVFSVQRQSLSGESRIVKLIVATRSAR